MIEVRELERFSRWFAGLNDLQAKARILARIRRLSLGNAGDAAPVGDGVSEMRIHHGPGYRLYFKTHGSTLAFFFAAATSLLKFATFNSPSG